MKASTAEGVTVSILGKEFVVACSENERASLQNAASFLDRKMREIQSQGKIIGTERVAIMAALNLAYELLELRGQGGIPADLNQKLRSLQTKIESVLHQ